MREVMTRVTRAIGMVISDYLSREDGATQCS